MSLGEQIENKRNALGLSREAVAARADVSLNTIIRLERSIGRPHRATLAAVQAALADLERETSEAAGKE